MKKVLISLGVVFLAALGFLSVVAARYEETVRPNTKVGTVSVGGLTVPEAQKLLRTWWEQEKLKTLALHIDELEKDLEPARPSQLGVAFDDVATVAVLPKQDFLQDSQAKLQKTEYDEQSFEPVYKPTGYRPLELIQTIKDLVGTPQPATVRFDKGTIFRTPETTIYRLDEPRLYDLAVAAIKSGDVLHVPLKVAPKRISDDDLKSIHEVVSEFSTRFSAGNRPRSENIRLASEKIDGVILLPGEKFSFNGTVGRRTKQAGFQEAGVYINGRHDTGIGGGICQVSTTLYNAALYANMAIKRRSNHSMPVPYVPVGRDATVDYGNLDFIFQNSYDHPIAINSQYRPGRLTFRILGTKIPGLRVRLEQGEHRSFPAPEQRVTDPSLPAGKTRVVEWGSAGHSVQTFRVVIQDGKVVKRQSLGRSYYGASKRVIAVGAKPNDAMSAPLGTVSPAMPR